MENNHTYIILLFWIFVSFSTLVHIAESSNSSEITGLDSDEYAKTINCSLMPERERKRLKLDKLIDENNRLIKLSITVKWNEYQPNETYPTDMLWFLATDTTETHLLLLDDNFTVMSLGTLSYGIASMQLTLTQDPENCLQNMTAEEADKVLKYTMLTLPETSKAVNEDGISLLHICTGSVNANGSCCNLTLTGANVQCFLLAKDTSLSSIFIILAVVTLILFMRIFYFIPRSIYANDTDKSYTLLKDSNDKIFSIKLKMKTVPNSEHDDDSDFDKNWTKVRSQDISDKLLQEFKVKIKNHIEYFKSNNFQDHVFNFRVKLMSVVMDADQLVSECSPSLRLSYSLFKTFSDIFLKCKVKNADFLRQIFCEPFYGNLRRSVCINRITKLFIILFCLLPFICRIIFNFKYNDSMIVSRTVAITNVVFLAFILVICLVIKQLKENIAEILQSLQEKDIEEKMKTFTLITLSPLCFKNYLFGFFLLPFTFIFGMIVLIYLSLPLLQLPKTIISLIKKNKERGAIYIIIVYSVITTFYLVLCFTMFFLMDCIVFYTKCFSYISIGLLLNFDNVSNIILLILIVLTYAYDCLSRAYNRINHFNNRVMKVLCEFIDTCNTSDKEKLYQSEQMKICVAEQHPHENQSALQYGGSVEDLIIDRRIRVDDDVGEPQEEKEEQMKIENKLFRLNMLSQTADQFITIRADGEGKLCLSTTGLLIYYKFQDPEHLPFMHVSERFFDELSSQCGQLTPGPKYMVLFRACKEIACLLIALYVVFLVISGFGRLNDISAGINAFVTIGSSTALVMINRLLFKSNEYSLNDHDSHLKALVEKHAKGFRDLWSDTSLEITDCDIDTTNVQSVNSQSAEDSDIIVEICHKGENITESWYVRPVFQNKRFPKMKVINCCRNVGSRCCGRKSSEYESITDETSL